MELGWANITQIKILGQKKQILPFEGMGQIYFHLADFFGPSGRTPLRGPGNTGPTQKIHKNICWSTKSLYNQQAIYHPSSHQSIIDSKAQLTLYTGQH